MAEKHSDVVIVIDDKAVRVPYQVWRLFRDCAGQMVADGDHFDYYKGNEAKATLQAVSALYDKTA